MLLCTGSPGSHPPTCSSVICLDCPCGCCLGGPPTPPIPQKTPTWKTHSLPGGLRAYLPPRSPPASLLTQAGRGGCRVACPGGLSASLPSANTPRLPLSRTPHLCLFRLSQHTGAFGHQTDQARSGPVSTQLCPAERSMVTQWSITCAVHEWPLSICNVAGATEHCIFNFV